MFCSGPFSPGRGPAAGFEQALSQGSAGSPPRDKRCCPEAPRPCAETPWLQRQRQGRLSSCHCPHIPPQQDSHRACRPLSPSTAQGWGGSHGNLPFLVCVVVMYVSGMRARTHVEDMFYSVIPHCIAETRSLTELGAPHDLDWLRSQ